MLGSLLVTVDGMGEDWTPEVRMQFLDKPFFFLSFFLHVCRIFDDVTIPNQVCPQVADMTMMMSTIIAHSSINFNAQSAITLV